MSLKDFASMASDIRAKKFHPVYFLQGEETYFIDKLAELLEANVLTQEEKSFNYQVLYGKDTNMLQIITAARRFPMMAKHQLIIVREAQILNNLDDLIPYLNQVLPSTILVFLFKGKKLNKLTKVSKALQKFGCLTFDKIKENEMSAWITNHIQSMGLKIQHDAKELLLRSSGSELSKIANELDKINANLGGRTEMTLQDVMKHADLDKSYNMFSLTRSLGERNRFKTMEIAQNLGANPKDNPLVVIIANIFSYFRKVHLVHFSKSKGNSSEIAKELGVSPYFVSEYIRAANNYPSGEMRRIFALLHEFDLKSKGMDGGHATDSQLLTELMIRILN